MEPENIDWSNIESIFVEDETYEGFKAPKWVDLSVSDELIDDEAWFCNPGKKPKFNLLYLFRKYICFILYFTLWVADCKHPKSAEDFFKSARSLKVVFILFSSGTTIFFSFIINLYRFAD